MLFFEYPPLNVFSKTSAPFSIVPAVISTPVFIPLAATLVTVFVVSPTAIPKKLAIAPIIGPNIFAKNCVRIHKNVLNCYAFFLSCRHTYQKLKLVFFVSLPAL